MEYECPICHAKVDYELTSILSHGDEHIIATIKEKHPEWEESGGICRKCYEHYQGQLHP